MRRADDCIGAADHDVDKGDPKYQCGWIDLPRARPKHWKFTRTFGNDVAMHPTTVFSLALGLILATLQPLSAQTSRGNVDSGRRYAINWCSGCHAAEPRTVGIFAADFTEIAKLPSTTALSLKVFLQTSHRSMPNFILQPEESNDIVAYILSLKRK